MQRRSYQPEGKVIRRSAGMLIAVMMLCACSATVFAQWTQPDASGNINSTNTGNVGVGTTAPAAKLTVSSNTQSAPAAQPGTTAHIIGANSATARLVVDAFGPVGSSIDMRKANNTAASPTAVGNNEILGQITWQGRGATSYNAASRAKIMVSAAENYTDTGQGAFMTFSVAPIGAITSVEAMRISASGFIGIGTTVPAYRLDVGGTVNATAFAVGGVTLVGSQWTTSGTTINYGSGNVGIGAGTPTEKLHVTGNVKVTGNIDVGGNINAKYQDVAEWVESTQELSAGTVVILDSNRSNQVIASTSAYDTRVAGVISMQPGIALGEHAEGRVLVATTGRVKVKVDARNSPIRIGDLLVTSDLEGVAMKSIPVALGGVHIHRPGTLIGKALEPLTEGMGEILVLLSLQ